MTVVPDFSRSSFDPDKDYTGVLLQQGRALVDAEWNEQCAVINEQMRRSLAAILNAFPNQLSPVYEGIHLSGRCYKVKLQAGVFFVQGVRCEPEWGVQPDKDGYISVTYLGTTPPPPDRCTISVHAWEKVISSAPAVPHLIETLVSAPASAGAESKLSDPALDNSDSGLRTRIAWRLQADAMIPEGCDYQSWVRKQRGTIQVKPLCGRHDASPCLYRVEIGKDANSITKNNIRLWQDGHPIDTPDGKSSGSEFTITLGGRLQIVFDAHKPYRGGDYWLIPYRGERTSKLVGNGWLPPSGQHYYAKVPATAVEWLIPPKHFNTVGPLRNSLPEATPSKSSAQVSEPATGLSKQGLIAAAMLGEVHCLPLKKWLSTALLTEILTSDFDTFWYRLMTQLPQVALGDTELRMEALQLWNTAQRVKQVWEPAQSVSPTRACIGS